MSGKAERALLERLLPGRESPRGGRAIFILGAPRTGSTIFYQAVCSWFDLPYISNFTNDCFPQIPIVGLSIQRAMPVDVGFDSRYGKTEGAFQPSEGSAVMTHWFGGGHPSELVSARVLDGAELHFRSTIAAAEALFEAPLVMKNAWNCFRVRSIAETLPSARFLWIRRDIAEAATSDLKARYTTKGSANTWNSATPLNVEELRNLDPAAQVVENQVAFNESIGNALSRLGQDRWKAVWYEDFCADPDGVLSSLVTIIDREPRKSASEIRIATRGKSEPREEIDSDVDRYVSGNAARLSGCHYSSA
ncbi:MAG: hypothetical protein BMS9Abin05_2650 [Rhodothermia bacterium]|nr:MAG: hypothetical protein BMS9Abin05_2650 [Rhodothermia bacterium]